jgi:hypothetical protein
MNLKDWFKHEWHDIKGNAKWGFYKWIFGLLMIVGAAVVSLGAYFVHKFVQTGFWEIDGPPLMFKNPQ